MKNLIFLLFTATLLFYACGSDCPMKKALDEATGELEKAKTELAILKNVQEGKLVHVVHIKTRPDLSEEEIVDLKSKLISLSTIEGVLDMELGEPAETNDLRLNSDYNYVLQMRFATEADLTLYQKNEFHLKARESTKGYLAGPPVVFDYWVK